LDEVPLDLVRCGPGLHCHALELRAVVAANLRRLAVPFAQLLQNTHHAATADAEVNLDGESITSEVVDHVERPEGTTIGERVVHEIHRPAQLGSIGCSSGSR